jgi:hypothetical protein
MHAIPKDKVITSEVDTLLKRPELAAQIGNIAANWATVEQTIMFLYALLLGTDLPHGSGGNPTAHPVAFQIFSALYALDRRIDLLERLLKDRGKPEEAQDFERRLKPLLRKRFNERSLVVHSVWGICDDYPDALVLHHVPFINRMLYRVRDFEEISQRIKDVSADLLAFGDPIYRRLQRPKNALAQPKSSKPARPRKKSSDDSGKK